MSDPVGVGGFSDTATQGVGRNALNPGLIERHRWCRRQKTEDNKTKDNKTGLVFDTNGVVLTAQG
jgi:hypothetical protein